MESTNFNKDCVKLSENFETSENGCDGTILQQNQVQSSNFTHILKNLTKPIEINNTPIHNKKTKLDNNLNIELREFNILEALRQKDNFHKPMNFLVTRLTCIVKATFYVIRFLEPVPRVEFFF